MCWLRIYIYNPGLAPSHFLCSPQDFFSTGGKEEGRVSFAKRKRVKTKR